MKFKTFKGLVNFCNRIWEQEADINTNLMKALKVTSDDEVEIITNQSNKNIEEIIDLIIKEFNIKDEEVVELVNMLIFDKNINKDPLDFKYKIGDKSIKITTKNVYKILKEN